MILVTHYAIVQYRGREFVYMNVEPIAAAIEGTARVEQTIDRESGRLRSFIRKHVADWDEAEDILQDVFYEFLLAYRLTKPIENAAGWLFRVARNRITDLFRRNARAVAEPIDPSVEAWLPARDGSPEAGFARTVAREAILDALDDLPPDQRAVFVAHELEGQSFAEISARSGVGVNTLLSRKRYAVLFLRERLKTVYEELKKG